MVRLTRLKDVRQRKALTQQQLAEKAGVNRVTVARIEGGKDEPFPTTVRKMADALGVEPEELLEPVVATAASNAAHAHGPANGAVATAPLDARITVVNQEDVSRFLRSAPDLIPLINEAAHQLVRLVSDAQLTVMLLVDPDYGANEELLLQAATDLDDDVAMEALNRFDQEWWVPNVRRARGLLVIDLL